MATVLVVDDRQVNRDLVRTVLRYHGHETIEAPGGIEALEVLRTTRPDLVIADVLMPGMDGYELARAIRTDTQLNSIPVLFYTANYVEEEIRPIASAVGVDRVVTKSGDLTELISAIDDTLGSTPVSEPVDPREFDREHLRVLNAKLLEKIEELEEAARLHQMVDAIVAVGDDLRLSAMLRRIASAARSLVGAHYSGLVTRPVQGRGPEYVHLGGDAAVVRQVETAPATHVADLDVLGYLVVPIRIDGETFGSLVLRQAPGTEFTSGDKHLLETLARAAGVAIANSQLYDDARRREEWLAASADVASTVLASEPAKAMGLVASGARRVVGADMAWVAVREADDVVVGAWDGRLPDAFARQIVPVAEAVLFNEVSTTGQPVVIDDASRDERVRTPEHVHGFVGPLLAVPLVASERTLGVLFIGNAQGGAPFGRLDVEMARVFAARAAMTLQFARAAADRQKLTLLADRNRIARDLHDVVIQRLFGLGLRLERIREQQHGRVAAELADINDDLDQTIDEIRNTIFSLRVSGDERASLRGQLLQVVEPFRGLLPLAPRVRIDGPIDNVVPEAVAPHLVASLSEALSNVVRHAHARQVDVVVEVDGGHLTLRVTDDGTGVPEQRVESGLANLRRRASELGGSMRLERRQDRSGTVLVWTVPLSENGAVADDEERVLTS